MDFSAYTITLAYFHGHAIIHNVTDVKIRIRSIFQWVILLHTLK